jgi:hypothetical protein
MRPARHPAVAAAARLRQALEQRAAALTAGQVDQLLAGESALQDAVAAIPRPSTLSDDDRRELRAELDAAADALVRCRHLGTSLTAFVRIRLDAQGRAAGYDPAPDVAARLGGRTLNTLV